MYHPNLQTWTKVHYFLKANFDISFFVVAVYIVYILNAIIYIMPPNNYEWVSIFFGFLRCNFKFYHAFFVNKF
jgi:hypothetical protein